MFLLLAVKRITTTIANQFDSKRLKFQWSSSAPLLLTLFLQPCIEAFATTTTSFDYLARVRTIAQDEQGYIWFAGQHGLTRYDGASSITFSSTDKQWNTPFTWVHDIKKVKDKLLISTESSGLWLFDPKNSQTQKIPLDIEQRAIYDAAYFNRYFYFNMTNKLYKVEESSGKTSVVKDNSKVLEVLSTAEYLYFSTDDGLYRQSKNNQLEQIISGYISKVAIVNNGVVAISNNRLNFVDNKGIEATTKIDSDVIMLTNSFDGQSIFSLSTTGKIEKYHSNTLETEPHNYSHAESTTARQFLHDQSGVLWVVSNQGIQQVSEDRTLNHPLLFNIQTNANELALYKKEIVIGSYGAGIHSFKPTSDLIPESINLTLTKQAQRTMDLVAIKDSLYIASFDGLWFFNSQSQLTKKLDIEDNDKILLHLKNKDNLLYVGTNDHGFYIYDLDKKSVTEIIDEHDGLSKNEVLAILPLENDIWIGTSSGVDIFNPITRKIKNIDIEGSGKVVSLTFAKEKIFAFTKGDGVFVFNKQGDFLSKFGVGIDFTNVSLINNEIWAPAHNGLYIINPTNNKSNLMPNTEQYSFADAPILKDGRVFISHYGGVLEVPLQETTHFNAKIHISETTVTGQTSIGNKSININSPNDVVSLKLASLDYRSGKVKQFQYQINNEKWHSINNNQLTLTGLAPGDYRITIRGTNSLGQLSAHEAFTSINVAYPWYWTPEIRIIYALILTGTLSLCFWLLYLRSQSITRIYESLSNNNKERGKTSLMVSRNLSLASDLLAQYKVSKSSESLEEITEIIEKTREDVDQRFDNNEPDNLKGNSLTAALSFLKEYLERRYHVNLAVKLDFDETELSYELLSDIYKINYEALTSAIANGSGRNFVLNIQEFKSKIWLTISDDNSSFIHFKSKINFDISMYYIRQIAKKYSASVNTFDEHGGGSQLVISIPLMQIS